MLKTKNMVLFGIADVGMRVPGMVSIGNEEEPPKISTIDLTTEMLDPRVTYQCSSNHAYKSQNGLINFSDANVYPLEYVNGVGVGRHEPEPESVNYLAGSANSTGLPWSLSSSSVVRVPDIEIAPDGTEVTGVRVVDGGALRGVYQRDSNTQEAIPHAFSAFVKSPFALQVRAERNADTFPTSSGNQEQWEYLAQNISGENYTANYNGTMLIYNNASTGVEFVFWAWGGQFEIGRYSTSPIMTDPSSGATAKREASSVTIATEGASEIIVNYTDGTSSNYDVTGAAEFSLPQASNNWGARYITNIELIP